MPVSVERFESQGSLPGRLGDATGRSIYPFQTQCHYCGFSEPDPQAAPTRCPKCGGSTWDQTVVPGALLLGANRLSQTTGNSRVTVH